MRDDEPNVRMILDKGQHLGPGKMHLSRLVIGHFDNGMVAVAEERTQTL
jgi:hypothetical protein